MSFRKEIKFKLSRYDFEILKSSLLLKGMQPLYKKREINSMYYDTQLLDMFKDSEEGLLPRKKIRVRWYKNISESKLEVKISSLEGRFKTTAINNFLFRNTMTKKLYDLKYGVLNPSLLVSYNREYYSLKKMRLTFDSSIQYKNYRQSKSVKYSDKECVMEIKVSPDVSDDYIQSIIPWPATRFSKYCRGILNSVSEI